MSIGKCTPTNIRLMANSMGQRKNTADHLIFFRRNKKISKVIENELAAWPEKKL
tara:strand:+ start:713 stop:874 length:162 start_codon:yes stop_codon:yes gene_type:complete